MLDFQVRAVEGDWSAHGSTQNAPVMVVPTDPMERAPKLMHDWAWPVRILICLVLASNDPDDKKSRRALATGRGRWARGDLPAFRHLGKRAYLLDQSGPNPHLFPIIQLTWLTRWRDGPNGGFWWCGFIADSRSHW